MALWQYHFHVFPIDTYSNQIDNIVDLWHSEAFDEAILWKNHKIEDNFFNEIEKVLKKSKSWSKDILLYGQQESNCFEIIYENGQIVSMSFRIDYTKEYNNLLIDLIELFLLNNLVVLNENLEAIPLNLSQFKAIIANSPQVKKYICLLNKTKKTLSKD